MSNRRTVPRAGYILLLLLLAGFMVQAKPQAHIIILHTNDIHGHVESSPDSGGIAALSTIVRKIQPDLMLDGGDMFTGSAISDRFEGEPVVAIMNAIGYDAAALGSHEFDRGLDALQSRALQANFPFLSANTISIDEVHDAAIFNAQGVRIAVIGVTTESVRETGHPLHMKNVQVIDVVKGIENALPKVRDRADLIVVLTHLPDQEGARIARAFPEIRLISGTESAKPPGPLQSVGRVDVAFTFDRAPEVRTSFISLKDVEADPEITRILAPYADKVEQTMRQVLGQAVHELTLSTSSESHVQNLVADAVRRAAGTQIAFLPVEEQRAAIPQGPITGRELSEVIPNNGKVVTMTLTGAEIKKLLAHSVMAVSGIRLRMDMRKPAV